jgi:hypothetical protein
MNAFLLLPIFRKALYSMVYRSLPKFHDLLLISLFFLGKAHKMLRMIKVFAVVYPAYLGQLQARWRAN